MRACSKPMRDAVDAQVGSLEWPKQQDPNQNAPMLSAAACARLRGVHTMTLRSMRCMRAMLPGVFPRLQSLRLLLEDDAVIESDAAYKGIASAAPWLTHLNLPLPASATMLPQQMASLLAACSKLEDLELHAQDELAPAHIDRVSLLVGVDALAAGTQLLSLRLPMCTSLTNLAPLGALVNLQCLNIGDCYQVSDLGLLEALVNLQTLDISGLFNVSDLTPLVAMVNLTRLNVNVEQVSDLAFLRAMGNLQRLSMCTREAGTQVSDLAPLGALVFTRRCRPSAWLCSRRCLIWRPSQP
ncbi:hypothetical protein FOA52_002715 [Chlamydomonas sp. UWO 241]|nr:hypothetical protein FOA52_002715 [Chlamydomonas sp. UWO 241]